MTAEEIVKKVYAEMTGQDISDTVYQNLDSLTVRRLGSEINKYLGKNSMNKNDMNAKDWNELISRVSVKLSNKQGDRK